MNLLNSLILEGEISIEIPASWNDEKRAVLFIKNQQGEFEIVIPGENMVKATRSQQELGRGLRVVGKIIAEDGRIKVLAEHIEFKMRKPKKVN